MSTSRIRIELPQHLRTLAKVHGEVQVEVQDPATLRGALDALEAACPVLRGTIRDYATGERRAFLRFFVCGEDWSHTPTSSPLPKEIASGKEPLLIIGAIAGG